jgi:hypothetical protein
MKRSAALLWRNLEVLEFLCVNHHIRTAWNEGMNFDSIHSAIHVTEYKAQKSHNLWQSEQTHGCKLHEFCY